VRSVASTNNLFSPVERPRRQWALALLSFLETQRLCPARPLVLYAFSNGGAFVVEQLKKIAEQEPRSGCRRTAIKLPLPGTASAAPTRALNSARPKPAGMPT